MKSFFPVEYLKQMPIEKPKFSEPCNGCGLCCRVQACQVSTHFLKSTQAPCVALEYHDEKFQCGMVLRPEHYLGNEFLAAYKDKKMPGTKEITGEELSLGECFAKLIYSGEGCGMPDEITLVRGKETAEAIIAEANKG
jgi:hypothetical protein